MIKKKREQRKKDHPFKVKDPYFIFSSVRQMFEDELKKSIFIFVPRNFNFHFTLGEFKTMFEFDTLFLILKTESEIKYKLVFALSEIAVKMAMKQFITVKGMRILIKYGIPWFYYRVERNTMTIGLKEMVVMVEDQIDEVLMGAE